MILTGEYARRMELLCDDLESGNHVQGKGKLHIIPENGPDQFCCLGRASVIAAENGCDVERTTGDSWDEFDNQVTIEIFDGNSETLCHAVAVWYGLLPEGGVNQGTNLMLDVEGTNPMLDAEGEEGGMYAAVLNDQGGQDGTPYDLPRIGRAFRRTYLGESSGDSGGITSAS